MMRLDNVEMIRLAPGFMRDDNFVRAFCEAADEQFRKLADELRGALIYVDADQLPEHILDAVAHDLHVDYYNAGDDIEIKRRLVAASGQRHAAKGTNPAIEELMGIVFGDGEVEEWFQYDGRPGYFKVWTSNISATTTHVDKFMDMLQSVKRGGAFLDGVFIRITATCGIYIGVVTHIAKFYTTEVVNL